MPLCARYYLQSYKHILLFTPDGHRGNSTLYVLFQQWVINNKYLNMIIIFFLVNFAPFLMVGLQRPYFPTNAREFSEVIY